MHCHLDCTTQELVQIEAHAIENQIFIDNFIWHDRLDHPGSIMMRKFAETFMWSFIEKLRFSL